MSNSKKTLAIVFYSIAAVVLIAGIICMILTSNVSKNAAMGLIVGVPFAILLLLFIFLGTYNLVLFLKEKNKPNKF